MASIDSKDVRKLVVACDAGMGSSVMLASQLRKQLKGTQVEVVHTPVNSIPEDADVIVSHVGLAERARVSAPGVVLVPFQIFIGDPAVTRLVT
ncbi:PTS lactose transporter subunit IIB, partial [Acrocarpospora sp. B8E8]|uniref:PTS lactose transporter subunit IIB n=1 Tax=Acrocarpospora sp. B8E8 TaxID=3153572 RepID=UPI00325F0715